MNKKMIMFLMSAVMLSGSLTPVKLFAVESPAYAQKKEEISAKEKAMTSIFSIYNDKNYRAYEEAYKVTGIKSYVNNGGNYGSSSISKAFDNDLSTHWETGKPNNSTHKNEVIVTFDDIETINRVAYAVRQDNGFKGFSNEFSIYSSLEETGDDFELVATGNANTTREIMEFKFEPTQFKRLKFVFDKANSDWASASEFWFFKEDKVLDNIDKVFTDGLMMELSDKYKNDSIREEFLIELQNHPLGSSYTSVVEMATRLGEGLVIDADSIIPLAQKGDESAERNRTKISYALYAHVPTGLYLREGEEMDIYVDIDEEGVMPEVFFQNNNSIKLKPGHNRVTLPEDMKGSRQVYVMNRAYENQQAYQPRVRIEGGHPYPVYIEGKTDLVEYHKYLSEYTERVKAGLEPNIADIVSENIHIQTSARGAYKGLSHQLATRGKYADYTIEVYEDMYREYVEYSGFDYDVVEGREWNMRPRGKFLIVCSDGGPYGWAQHGWTGYNGGGGVREDSFWSGLVQANAIENGGWALFHEVAHQYDSSLLGTSESTNNLYSLIMQDNYIEDNRMVQEDRWEKHFTSYHNTKVYPNDQLFKGAITYQLQGVFGKQIYGDAQRIARENKNNWVSGLNNDQRMAVAISKAVGINLLPHYEYYGQMMNDKARSLVADLPNTELKTMYVNDKVFEEDAKAFENKEVKPVLTAKGTNEVTLEMSIEEDDKAFLCYEIYRDGEYLGVTYSNTFVDKKPLADTNHIYTAKAYDRKLNVSVESDAVVKNASQPRLYTVTEMNIPIHSEFNPLDYIKAIDSEGNNIVDRIEIISDNVNTSKKGTYEITYSVTDNRGNTTVLNKAVNVVSEVAYISDLNPVATKVGWGKLEKDKAPSGKTITLYNLGIEDTYAKGIGVHASSEVIYNIEDQGYTMFESYIGIDQAMSGTNASATFEVWLDGEKAYESGVFKHNTNKELISLPIEGVKEIKLVTTDAKSNGNGSDHTVWADAKFISTNSLPKLQVPKSISTKVGESIDYIGEYTAVDTEDGDLTNEVVVSGDVDFNRTGDYTITYTVTDSDGNVVEKTRSVAVVELGDYSYLTDYDWKSAHTSYGSVRKDASPSNGIIRLTDESNQEVAYEKGLGTHSTATVVYDLSDKDYKYFTANVGVDRAVYGSVGSVGYEVWVDGEKVFDSGKMNSKDPQKYVEIDINGAKEIKLITNDGGNGNGSDHGVWGDTKLHRVGNQEVDSEAKVALKALLQQADEIQYTNQEQGKWDNFVQIRELAREVCNNPVATDEECNEINAELKQAIEELDYIALDTSKLQALVDQAGDLDEAIYTGESWVVLNEKLSRAEEILTNEQLEVTQAQIDEVARELQEAIDNLEEKVIESEIKSELRQLLIEADKIEYTDQEQTRWNNFVYIRDLAQNIFNNPVATDRDYRDAIMHLNASMKDLDYKKVDTSKLQDLINEVLALDEEAYTVESWATLTNQVTIAQNVIASAGNSNTQEHVDQVTMKLQQAIDALEGKVTTPEIAIELLWESINGLEK